MEFACIYLDMGQMVDSLFVKRIPFVTSMCEQLLHIHLFCVGSFTAQSTTRSCRAGKFILALFLGRLRPFKRLTSTKRGRPRQLLTIPLGLTAETTIFQSCSAVSQKSGH